MKAPIFITGPVGAGKSSMMVNLMVGYLNEGRPVATNMDIYPEHMPLNAKGKAMPIIRLPDETRSHDLISLGCAYPIGPNGQGFDPAKAGGLFLDETAFFMNCRDWSDKDRPRLIKWLRLIRKKGWNGFFGVQDIDSIDNQIINALCKTVGSCYSTDNFLSMSGNPIAALILFPFKLLLRFVLKFFLRVERVHACSFYLGKSIHNGLKQETVLASGAWLYKAYNTAQEFTDGVEEYEIPVRNAKGEIQIRVKTESGYVNRFVNPDSVAAIPDCTIVREITSVDMRAMYTILPASYIDAWYPQAKAETVRLVPGFWPSLPLRAITWLGVRAYAFITRRTWRESASLLGVLRS